MSPDPLHYPEVFQGKSPLQARGWAVGSAHDQSSMGGMERDPGLGETIALARPLQLLGQPVPIQSFAQEKSFQPCCWG